MGELTSEVVRQEPVADLSLLRYRTQEPAARARVLLAQNMFTFLLEGEKTVHFAGAQVTVKPHQFVLLSPGNCLMSEKIVAPAGAYHSLLLLFDHQVLTDFFSQHASWLGQPVQSVASQPFLLFDQDDFLRSYTHSLDCLVKDGAPLPPALQRVKLEELLLYLAVHQPGQLQQLQQLSTEPNEERLIRQAIAAHSSSPVTVEELAFLCHMSLSTFKRRFARLYGTSPSRWLLERKMERAAGLLRQQHSTVSELCDELGYESLSGFVHSFKQVYGVTPKQYQLARYC